MLCTNCGHENPASARFCANCGAPLGEDVTISFTPSEGQEETREPPGSAEAELKAGQGLLVVTRGPNAGSKFLLDKDETSVGRYPESDIFLDDVTVSRRHAQVRRDEGRFFVEDVGSLNGTYVNGERVEATQLANADELQIGKFKLSF